MKSSKINNNPFGSQNLLLFSTPCISELPYPNLLHKREFVSYKIRLADHFSLPIYRAKKCIANLLQNCRTFFLVSYSWFGWYLQLSTTTGTLLWRFSNFWSPNISKCFWQQKIIIKLLELPNAVDWNAFIKFADNFYT